MSDPRTALQGAVQAVVVDVFLHDLHKCQVLTDYQNFRSRFENTFVNTSRYAVNTDTTEVVGITYKTLMELIDTVGLYATDPAATLDCVHSVLQKVRKIETPVRPSTEYGYRDPEQAGSEIVRLRQDVARLSADNDRERAMSAELHTQLQGRGL